MKKHQILLIHGGAAYRNYKDYIASLKSDELDEAVLGRNKKKDWKDTLGQKLGRNYDVIYPEMPNWMNAKYFEWKIWFEKLSVFFKEPIILIGHSLGGIFLSRYLGENISPKKVKAVFLVAAPYKLRIKNNPLGDFFTPGDLSKITDQCQNVFIYHSQDDAIVPFKNNYRKYIAALPGAHGVAFKNKGHFNQITFPELVKSIRCLPNR
jgi:uncharacterized protein